MAQNVGSKSKSQIVSPNSNRSKRWLEIQELKRLPEIQGSKVGPKSKGQGAGPVSREAKIPEVVAEKSQFATPGGQKIPSKQIQLQNSAEEDSEKDTPRRPPWCLCAASSVGLGSPGPQRKTPNSRSSRAAPNPCPSRVAPISRS